MRAISLVFALSLLSPVALAVETNMTCTEVSATEAKCAEYDTVSKACDTEVDAGIKDRLQKLKTADDECKKKHGISYPLKCKKEIKEVTAAKNSPRQVSAAPVQKDLLAKADSSCAKAEALGKATAVCKGPKTVIEAMKRNCIK